MNLSPALISRCLMIWSVFAFGMDPQLFPAQAQTGRAVYFPTPSEGNAFSTTPFTAGPGTSFRFQQVYDFLGRPVSGIDGPFLIRSITFREDETHQFGFFTGFTDFQLNFSTTSRSADGLSSVFSENVGPDDTVIIPRGEFSLGAGQAIIRLPAPFLFDPREGNLLLDIRNYGGGGTTWSIPPFVGPAYLDAENTLGDRVSSVSADSINSLSGTTSTLGLMTTFFVIQVPEPSSSVLAAFACLMAFGIRWVQTCNR